MKYRKKSVTIEAVPCRDIIHFRSELPEAFKTAIAEHVIEVHANHVIVKTLEGDHLGRLGDMIIQGVKGEFYPCKPDIFDATYDRVEE